MFRDYPLLHLFVFRQDPRHLRAILPQAVEYGAARSRFGWSPAAGLRSFCPVYGLPQWWRGLLVVDCPGFRSTRVDLLSPST